MRATKNRSKPAAAPQSQGSLTIAQYSQLIVQRYLDRQYDAADPARNTAAAAAALFELQAKVLSAAGARAEDTKAPLKAVRDAIDRHAYHGAHGADSPEVEALLRLLAGLEAACEEHLAAAGPEREAALGVQDTLRYRLSRLVTGEAWDARPALKHRVLKLMFRFWVRENEALLAASRAPGAGGVRVLRTSSSFGRKAAQVAQSRWGEAINELQRMQGTRLLPLLKLSLGENLKLSMAAEAAAAAPTAASAAGALPAERRVSPGSDAGSSQSTGASSPSATASPTRQGLPQSPATPAQGAGGRLRQPPPPPAAAPTDGSQAQQAQQAKQPSFSLDDLLGLTLEEPQDTEPSPSPSASADAFAAFGAFAPPAAGPVAGGAAPTLGSHNPFVDPSLAFHGSGSSPQLVPAGPGSGGSGGGAGLASFSSAPALARVRGAEQEPAARSAPTNGGRGAGLSSLLGAASPRSNPGYVEVPRPNSELAWPTEELASSPKAAASYADLAEAPSPYLGISNPFSDDAAFADLAPQQVVARRAPPPPPVPGPPMRQASGAGGQ